MWRWIWLGLLAGCATQGELERGLTENARYTSRVVGFALEAEEEALRTRRALLVLLEGHPRRAELEQELGTAEELEQKAARVAAARHDLVEEGKRLVTRFGAPED